MFSSLQKSFLKLELKSLSLRAFDVEISERSTLNAFWKLRAFDVERFLKAQSVRRRTLFESFAFEPSTAIAFKSLKSQSCRTFERFKIADEG